jgi:hypothetical protein
MHKFEEKHGEVELPQRPSLADQLFGSIKPSTDDNEDEGDDE